MYVTRGSIIPVNKALETLESGLGRSENMSVSGGHKCTGYSKKISNEKARSIGIDAFLMKPVALYDMATAIRAVLE